MLVYACAILLRPALDLILPLPNITDQPIHTLLHALPIYSTTRHNTPIPIFELAQLERLAYLPCPFCAWLILLVREDEECGVAQLLFVEHCAQFFGRGGETLDVCGVDDEDYSGRVGIVAAPVGADRGLTAQVLNDGVRAGLVGKNRYRKKPPRTQTLKFRFL